MNLQCCYTRHSCSRFRYRDYRFCFQHILEDKSAPFVACQYVSNITNRRCHNPALKTDSSHSTITLCEVHQQHNSNIAGQVSRKRTKKSRHHPCRLDSSPIGKRKKFNKTKYEKTEAASDTLNYKNELVDDSYDHDADLNSRWLTTRSPSWRGGEPDIDADSTDDENPLKNAGVYTFEEVVSNSKHCLVKLQSLYVKQFKQLNRKLQAKRRNYLLHVNQDNISAQSSSKKRCVEDSEKKAELQALLSYRRHSRTSLLLHNQAERRRMESHKGSNMSSIEPTANKMRCSLVIDHIRCKNTILPYTKYCTKHILEDPLQMLYKKCSFDSCKTPICMLSYVVKSKGDDITLFCPMHETFGPISDGLLASMKKIEAFNSKSNTLDTSLKDTTDLASEEQSKISFGEAEPTSQSNLDDTVEQDNITVDDKSSSNINIVEGVTDQVSSVMEEHMEHPLLTIDEDQLKPEVSQADETSLQNQSQNLELVDETSEKMNSKPEDLTTSDIAHLKTGQCYVLSKVSLFDSDGPLKTPAVQLKPVGCSAQTLLVKALPQVQKSSFNNPSEPKTVLHVNPDAEKAGSSCAELHHQGSIMTVSSVLHSVDQHQFKEKNSKVSTSAVLVPPVEAATPDDVDSVIDHKAISSNQATGATSLKTGHDSVETKTDSDELVTTVRSPMPPSEPIVSCTGPMLERRESPSDNVATAKPELCDNKGNNASLEDNTTSTSVAAISDIPPLEAIKSNNLSISSNLGSLNPIFRETSAKDSDVLKELSPSGSPPLDNSFSDAEISPKASDDSIQASNDDNCSHSGSDVQTAGAFAGRIRDKIENTSSESDRKPSSADEETAIASLLSLSTGALANENT